MSHPHSPSIPEEGRPPHEWTVRETLAVFAAGRISPLDYVESLFVRQTLWPRLNAYCAQSPEAVRAAAQQAMGLSRQHAPLAGIPFAVKDNIDVQGYATTDGTPGLLGHRPLVSAPLIQGLIDRGAVMMGKTGLHELAAGGTCANLVFGPIRNPYNLNMVPGGSSGGTAAAVAARLVPAALGTDTAGSVRAPASHCGCVGFRPTTGRYDHTGMVPGATRRDTMGWITRSVVDIELLDRYSGVAATRVPALNLVGLRLGVPRAYFYEELHPAVQTIAEASLERLKAHGVVLVEADIPHVGERTARITAAIRREFPSDLSAYLNYCGSPLTAEEVIRAIADPKLRGAVARSLTPDPATDAEYHHAMSVILPVLKREYADYFNRNKIAAVVVPTCPEPPYPVPDNPAEGGTGPVSMIRNTEPGTHAGIPSLSVPAGLTPDGLPVGMQFDGPAGADETVLWIGRAFESMTSPLPPPVPERSTR